MASNRRPRTAQSDCPVYVGVRRAVETMGAELLICGECDLQERIVSGRLAAEDFYGTLIRCAYRLLVAANCGTNSDDLPFDVVGEIAWPEGLRHDLVASLRLDSAVDAERLGRSYERLLELRPCVDPTRGTFTLDETTDRRRKTTGTYYTPPELIESLLDTALNPVVETATENRSPEEAVGALLRMRVCDPACGSGLFLTAAARRLGVRLARLRGDRDPRPAIREVVGQCLFGADLDPTAVELCRASLWIEAGDFELDRASLDRHIQCRDSLTSPPPGAFDVVLGNPPYGVKQSRELRKTLSQLRSIARRAGNSAADFVALGLDLVADHGRVGFVVPKSLTYSYAWAPLRGGDVMAITHAVDVGRAWPEVRLEQTLLTYRPADDGPVPMQLGTMIGGGVRWTQRRWDDVAREFDVVPTGLCDEDTPVLEAMLRHGEGTIGDRFRTRRGAGVQRHATPRGDTPLLGGRDLAPFAFRSPSQRLPQEIAAPTTEPPQAVFQNIVAHITRPEDHIRLIGAVATERFACLDTVNLLSPRDDSPNELAMSPYAVTAYLSADLVNWFVYAVVYNRAVRTMHFDGYFLKKIPAPSPDGFAALDAAGRALAAEPDRPEFWKRLNAIVFDLFEVDEEHRRRITHVHASRRLKSGR